MAKKVKLTLNALGAAPDDFGRLRFLLLDELKSGKKDYSSTALARAIPPSLTRPFKLWDARDGVVGEFWVIAPKRKEKLFATMHAEARGKEVAVEVSLRRYHFTPPGKEESIAGISLDLLDITEIAAEEKKR